MNGEEEKQQRERKDRKQYNGKWTKRNSPSFFTQLIDIFDKKKENEMEGKHVSMKLNVARDICTIVVKNTRIEIS